MAASSSITKVRQTVDEIKKVSHNYSKIYVMFSGGRDSLVALHLLVMSLGTEKVEALYIDTGISTPGLKEYVTKVCNELNIRLTVIGPLYDYFKLVLEKGFPTITRRWCKEFLKERPLKRWLQSLGNCNRILLVTGVRRDESWMKRKASKFIIHPKFRVATFSPIYHWSKEDVIAYIRLYDLPENPLYKVFGKAYDCWCSVYKTPADFAMLALKFPEFFKKFVDVEAKLRSGGAGLFYNRRKVYFRDILKNPYRYLKPRL